MARPTLVGKYIPPYCLWYVLCRLRRRMSSLLSSGQLLRRPTHLVSFDHLVYPQVLFLPIDHPSTFSTALSSSTTQLISVVRKTFTWIRIDLLVVMGCPRICYKKLSNMSKFVFECGHVFFVKIDFSDF